MGRRIFENFDLLEISSVTAPAQKGAKMAIMKRQNPEVPAIAQIIMKRKTEGAKTFSEILQLNEERQKSWEVRDQLYPIFDAINDSVSSILADTDLTMEQKGKKVESSVNDFLNAVRAKFPEVEEEVAKLLMEAGTPGVDNKGESKVSKELEDKVTKLQGDLSTAQAALATATALAGMSDDQKSYFAKLDGDAKVAFEKATPEARTELITKSREGDEVIEVAGTKVRKSEVGAGTFAIFKAQAQQITAIELAAKADRESALKLRVTKRAETELAGLPGTVDDKIAVIKVVETDPAANAAFSKMMKSAQSAFAKMFDEQGVSDDITRPGNEGSAEAEITKKAEEVRKSNPTLSFEQSFARVLDENPGLYTRYNEESLVETDDEPTE